MKRILSAGTLALLLALTCAQQASAWFNIKMRVGFCCHWQSGGNSLLWGLFRNGHPGPEACWPPYYPPAPYPYDYCMTPYGSYDFVSAYSLPQKQAGNANLPLRPVPVPVPAGEQLANAAPQMNASAYRPTGYNSGYYFPASYDPNQGYNLPYQLASNPGHGMNPQAYTPFAAYNPSIAWPYSFQVPSYWYGR